MQELVWTLAPLLAAPVPQSHGHSGSAFEPLAEVRTIDGVGNNVAHPLWGSTGVAFRRLAAPAYADGVSAPSGAGRPSARHVSNLVVAQSGSIPNGLGLSDFVWQWGQLLDHDIDETPVGTPAERFVIQVPAGDPYFDPTGSGGVVIPMSRSLRIDEGGDQEQVNLITAYIDASNVYGSDAERAEALRTHDGTGKLKTSAGGLLPFNEDGLPNAPSTGAEFFLAGDFRANEQVGLTAMHTLFVREHNYWAERIAEAAEHGSGGHGGGHGHGGPGSPDDGHPERRRLGRDDLPDRQLTGDDIYELARAIVGAEMQAITFREFLPALLGPNAIGPYLGYRDDVDASILNEFATAGYRFGHSMLSPTLRRIEADGSTIAAGDLSLAGAFFNPAAIVDEGIEPVLRGLASQESQAVDNFVIDEVRNFLFGPPGAGGFDLAALNLQRGRDHGLATYNDVRVALGLGRVQGFHAFPGSPQVIRRLRAAYTSIDDIDPWIGALSETRVDGGLVGPTLRAMFVLQFEALRDGDRFWYSHALPQGLTELVEHQTLARVIRRNTTIGSELADDAFRVE